MWRWTATQGGMQLSEEGMYMMVDEVIDLLDKLRDKVCISCEKIIQEQIDSLK